MDITDLRGSWPRCCRFAAFIGIVRLGLVARATRRAFDEARAACRSSRDWSEHR